MAAGMKNSFNPKYGYKYAAETHPKKKKKMMTRRSNIRCRNGFASSAALRCIAADKSIPRSVNIPVKCVVRTTEPETMETMAFL